MNYTVNYSIISINYNEKKRTTTARIVCHETGEIFQGRAHRYPEDKMDIALGTKLAVARAVLKMVTTSANDDIACILNHGFSLQFDC